MSRNASSYRTFRKHWWLRPGVLLPALALLILSVPMLWWINTYGSIAATLMFAITYVSLTVWFIFFMKGNLLEPHIKVHEKVVDEKRKELEEHRRKERHNVYRTELEGLRAGRLTPVLDAWKIYTDLRSRHPLIESFRVCRIDPTSREFQIRVQLDDTWVFGEDLDQGSLLTAEVSGFLRFIVSDRDVRRFRSFFDVFVIEVYKLVDDGSLSGGSVPVLSLLGTWAEVERWAGSVSSRNLPGELMFAEGRPVTPHRHIQVL